MQQAIERLGRVFGLEPQNKFVRPFIFRTPPPESNLTGHEEQQIARLMAPFEMAGDMMFIDLHSHVPNPNIEHMFNRVGLWAQDHNLEVKAVNFWLEPGNTKQMDSEYKHIQTMLRKAKRREIPVVMIHDLHNIGLGNMTEFAAKDVPAFFANRKRRVALVVTTSHGLSLTEQTGTKTFGPKINVVQANIL